MTLQLEEGKKEARWMRERNQELERVVEALRKTIMRQADLSSQRGDQQGESLLLLLLPVVGGGTGTIFGHGT